MAKFKAFLVMLMYAMPMLTVLADSGGGQNNSTSDPGRTILYQKKNLSNRPNAPQRIYIECQYRNGSMGFIFPDGIYSVSVHIYNDLDNWWGIATTEESYIEIPSFNGEYIIECTSDDGRIFSGEIFF